LRPPARATRPTALPSRTPAAGSDEGPPGRSSRVQVLAFRRQAADILPLVAAAAIPLIFLHVMYQPSLVFGPATAYGSDIVIILTLLAAVASGLMFGWERLAGSRLLWLAIAGLVAVFALSCLYRPFQEVRTHLITVSKIGEYALLAPACVLLFRRAVDLERFLVVFVAWSAAASAWGLLQFLGLVNEFDGKRPGQREVSFIGHESFGAFTGCALLLGLASLSLGERRRLAWAALPAGGLGVVLDGSISAYLGVLLATLTVVCVAWRARSVSLRRLLAIAAILLVVGAGVEAQRGSDVSNYLSVIGIHASNAPESGVETGSQRELLLYIGLRIWEAHPWLGVGFGKSNDRYQPYLAAARRRYPEDPPLAFPSPAHRWGIQNFWLQLLADTGIPGFLLGLAVFAAGALGALRAFARNRLVALLALGWILVAAGTWTAIGIVAGIPLDAVTFLGLGLAAAAGWIGEPGESGATLPARS